MPGIAALPDRHALTRLQHFKQRRGPFLLLAANQGTAMRLARRKPAGLRRLMRKHWPGAVTLVFPARPVLPPQLLRHGRIAVRVDADLSVRALCRLAGGLLISSSLNRRGGRPERPSRALRWRWHRHLDAVLEGPSGAGRPSRLFLWSERGVRALRP